MSIAKKYPDYRPGKMWFKIIVTKIVFYVLGKALKHTSILDPEARGELEAVPDGYSLLFEVAPSGPYMAVKKENGRIRYIGQKKIAADMSFVFKNIDPAFMMLTAQMSFPRVYCNGSLGVVGDPAVSMIFYRVANIVQFYLWPKIIAKLVLKKVPQMTWKRFFTRLLIYIRIPF